MAKTVFERYEYKYLIPREKYETLLDLVNPYLVPDSFAHSEIANIYYDTPDFRLIRKSIEKPVYKEKLRMRKYGFAAGDSPIFVELKRKYHANVYKRRQELAFLEWSPSGLPAFEDSQIAREIGYFWNYYKTLRPAMYIGSIRDAYLAANDENFRVTFDTSISARQENLDFSHGDYGISLLPTEHVLMEIKTLGGMPGWMTNALSAQKIYPGSFSKYGRAYTKLLLSPHSKKENFADA